MKNTFIFIVLSLLCCNIYAAGRSYKIELLIFSQNMPNTEIFEQTQSRIAWPRKVIDRSTYKQVNREFMNLNESYAKLAGSQHYKPLIHVAWIQNVSANSLGDAVNITDSTSTVKGFFRLQRGNWVHMIVDIEYSSGSRIYRLNEKRRFKLNETHYLDHPKFGVLARVSLLSH